MVRNLSWISIQYRKLQQQNYGRRHKNNLKYSHFICVKKKIYVTNLQTRQSLILTNNFKKPILCINFTIGLDNNVMSFQRCLLRKEIIMMLEEGYILVIFIPFRSTSVSMRYGDKSNDILLSSKFIETSYFLSENVFRNFVHDVTYDFDSRKFVKPNDCYFSFVNVKNTQTNFHR